MERYTPVGERNQVTLVWWSLLMRKQQLRKSSLWWMTEYDLWYSAMAEWAQWVMAG